jgi:hypothetical protein
VTEIEIRDPDPTDPALTPSGGADAAPPPDGPYRNLLVPLVVVPALIVMVLVLVFVLFGALAGEEDSPRENLDRLLHGGFNERKQAAFNLVRQVIVSRQASARGGTPEWDIDASFLPELRAARAQAGEPEGPKDVPIPLVLSSLLAQLGDPEGVVQLAEMTRLSDALDPEREYRWYATMTLGAIGVDLAAPERELAAGALIGLLESEDAGLVLAAVAGLQSLPSPGTVQALEGMLTNRRLDLRASAALALAVLGDPSGELVLREMVATLPYEEERTADPGRWPAQRVSESRCKALAALDGLGVQLAADELERLATQDADPAVRQAAMSLRRPRSDG